MPVGVPVPGMNKNVHQIEHDLLREMLRRFLVAEVQSSRDTGWFGRVACGAVATLDSLLAAHPVDWRGRCRSCRRSGWPGRRPRVCLVLQKTHYWLRQPTRRQQTHLAAELGVDLPPLLDAADPETTEVLPRVADDPPTDVLQTPTIPLTPRFPAGRPDQDHDGAGVRPGSPRPRRGPSEDPPSGGRSLLLTGENLRVPR